MQHLQAEKNLLLTTARLLRELLREKPIQYEEELTALNAVLEPFNSSAEEQPADEQS